MKTIINPNTFIKTSEEAIRWGSGSRDLGTVECTLGGVTRTGTKQWPASVSVDMDGRECVWYGRDERVGRCTKSGLSFKN